MNESSLEFKSFIEQMMPWYMRFFSEIRSSSFISGSGGGEYLNKHIKVNCGIDASGEELEQFLIEFAKPKPLKRR